MKNFSDLTDIDTQNRLKVEVLLKKHGHTVSSIFVNQTQIFKNHTILFLDLLTNINFTIDLIEFDEGTSGIEIEKFSINGYEILPKYQHLANRPTNYIDKLGIWTLEIPRPFYPWYHEITGQGWIA